MENLNHNQTIIVEQLLQRSEKMRDLAKLIILKNTQGITKQSVAERVVRSEIEQIRLKKSIVFDGKKMYICGTNNGYSLETENSKVLNEFIKRHLKRLETSKAIAKSITKFIQQ